MPDVDQKLIDDFSFLISTVVPSLLKNVFTFAFGGQIGKDTDAFNDMVDKKFQDLKGRIGNKFKNVKERMGQRGGGEEEGNEGGEGVDTNEGGGESYEGGEGDNLMLEDGYETLFNFPQFKEFVKSITSDNN